MQFDILSVFPKAFESYFSISILARAQARGFIRIQTHDLRVFTRDKHKTVDDRPYGGGVGMVTRADVVLNALRVLSKRKAKSEKRKTKERIILLTPQGKVFDQKHAKRLSKYNRLILISGRYEGFDERIRTMVDEEISIGDFILSGGELPAMVVIDAVARLVPGVLGKEASLSWESFSKVRIDQPELKHIKKESKISSDLLEYPQYTRPELLTIGSKVLRVPKVLTTGDHARIFYWRVKEALRRTKRRRPDLLV